MMCLLCASSNQAEFAAEINIHFRGRENIDNPGVLVFPKVLVCLDCGSSRFSTPETELSRLARRPAPRAASIREGSVDDAVLRRRSASGIRLSGADKLLFRDNSLHSR
jgi:hypothetical protein